MKYRVLTTVVLIALIVLIFKSSATPVEASGARSEFVMKLLNSALAFLGATFTLTHHVVRKLAHFVEYAALGFWLILTLRAFTAEIKRRFLFPAVTGITVPVIDECIQLFFSGRSAQISDVFLDYCGMIFGMSIILVILRLTGKRKALS